MKSKYSGTCKGCQTSWEVGTEITKVNGVWCSDPNHHLSQSPNTDQQSLTISEDQIIQALARIIKREVNN